MLQDTSQHRPVLVLEVLHTCRSSSCSPCFPTPITWKPTWQGSSTFCLEAEPGSSRQAGTAAGVSRAVAQQPVRQCSKRVQKPDQSMPQPDNHVCMCPLSGQKHPCKACPTPYRHICTRYQGRRICCVTVLYADYVYCLAKLPGAWPFDQTIKYVKAWLHLSQHH